MLCLYHHVARKMGSRAQSSIQFQNVSCELHADHEKEMLIAGGLSQSRKHFFQHQHRDYRHYTSRTKEPFGVTLYKLELWFLAGRQCMGLL